MRKIFFFFLLTFCLNLDIDEYYRKQFTNAPLKIPVNLTNKTSSSEIPKIKFYKDIPNNSSILNISKEQIIISCSKFPYDEMLYQYINQYLSMKRISSSFYSELFNLLVKILYYKYAPLESIKNDFINLTEGEEFEYQLSKEKMEYIDIIYSRLNDSKFNFDTEKFDKEIIDMLKSHDIPDWYINSCKKIKYMFPKGHAVAYMMSAFRLGWYKIYKPVEYYAAYFTVRNEDVDNIIVMSGKKAIMKGMFS